MSAIDPVTLAIRVEKTFSLADAQACYLLEGSSLFPFFRADFQSPFVCVPTC
jgi:hypothetical protein